MSKTVLILGQSGRFGRNAAVAFRQAGWTVRGFDRSQNNLTRAACTANVIVNAWNPPYTQWASQVPHLHAQVRAAAKAADATVIVPGNVYVFGADTAAPWSEDSPHRAQNPLGRIRTQMEQAYAEDGVRTIILRAGDFLDTSASGNWFDQVMVKSLNKGVFTYPGKPDLAHAWAFLPDLARAAVTLAEQRHSLPVFADIPFPGYTLSGNEIAEHLRRVLARTVRLKRMNWWPLRIARPVWPMARHLLEMRYLWDTAHSLDGRLFNELVPDFSATPVSDALLQATQHTQTDATAGHPVQSV